MEGFVGPRQARLLPHVSEPLVAHGSQMIAERTGRAGLEARRESVERSAHVPHQAQRDGSAAADVVQIVIHLNNRTPVG